MQSIEGLRKRLRLEEHSEEPLLDMLQSGGETLQSLASEGVDRLMKCAYSQTEQAERIMRKALIDAWDVCHFRELPQWLQHNDYLHFGHRPQLGSFDRCFWSCFRLHTETCNIWTHVIGCMIFIALAACTLLSTHLPTVDKLVFGAYFAGAIVCLGLSSAYHMLSCHSPSVGELFCRLDYCGIALLITGSFLPCIYYGFYCDYWITKVVYTLFIGSLCVATIMVSLCDRFSVPEYRPLRAGVFFSFALSGIFPSVHWMLAQDWFTVANLRFSLFCIFCMAALYITGAALYAARIPERFFPGKFDVWFHSHQLFHIFVIAAAVVHYQGIHEMASHRLSNMCETDPSYVWSNSASNNAAPSASATSFSTPLDFLQVLMKSRLS